MAAMDLRYMLFWACSAVTLIAELFLLRSAFFPRAEGAPAPELSHSPRAVEMLWGVLPAIALAAVYAAAFHAMQMNDVVHGTMHMMAP